MRRWVCIVTLLAGFAGDARPFRSPPLPIPIHRPIAVTSGRLVRTPDWWRP